MAFPHFWSRLLGLDMDAEEEDGDDDDDEEEDVSSCNDDGRDGRC